MSLIERLRAACLAHGASGIKGFSRSFLIHEDSRSRMIGIQQLSEALNDYGVEHEAKELVDLFADFDQNHNGVISFDEFLEELRPPMNERRKSVVALAFKKMDKDNSGQISFDDLIDVYNVKKHPKYLNGEWTDKQCYQEFLKTFDSQDHPDGIITAAEFLHYYSAVSASIDDDNYFDLMIRNSWKI